MNERERDRPSDRKRDRETERERDREVNEPLPEGGIVGAQTEPPRGQQLEFGRARSGWGVARAPGGYERQTELPQWGSDSMQCHRCLLGAPSELRSRGQQTLWLEEGLMPVSQGRHGGPGVAPTTPSTRRPAALGKCPRMAHRTQGLSSPGHPPAGLQHGVLADHPGDTYIVGVLNKLDYVAGVV